MEKIIILSAVLMGGLAFSAYGADIKIDSHKWIVENKSDNIEVPDQMIGLPYTRSGKPNAIAKLKNAIALYPGSRYGYINGKKVRLDNKNWENEAVSQDGILYVPKSFAAAFFIENPTFDEAPEYLKKRWVYTLKNDVNPTKRIKIKQINGFDYVPADQLAQLAKLKRIINLGVWIAGKSVDNTLVSEATVTLFDTPEKFANPDLAIQHIPWLKRQGKWTDHVKVPADKLDLIENGPETVFSTALRSNYDLTGFDKAALGSEIPVPGVYPRIYLSPEDIPMLRQRVKGSKTGQKALLDMEECYSRSYLNPETSDGKIFEILASDDYQNLKFAKGSTPWHPSGNFEGQKPGVYSSHVNYNTHLLSSLVLYAIVVDDQDLGKKAATAAVNYYKLRERFNDIQRELSDSEFGSTSRTVGDGESAWRREFHPNQHLDLPFIMDFGGYYMTEEQKKDMYRIIAKYTYGRRSYGQDGPARIRDVNWMGWDLSHFLCNAAIEGQEGFDFEVYERGRESVEAFLQWGINKNGSIFESNGKSSGSWHCLLQSMLVLARRGDNYFGHPHFRAMMEGQAMVTSPTGELTVNSGTQYTAWRGQPLSPQFVDSYKFFFPEDEYADYLLSNEKKYAKFCNARITSAEKNQSLEGYAESLKRIQGLRLPSPGYPGMVNNVIFCADYKETSRKDINPPLTFVDSEHGVFSAYNDNSDKSMWVNMISRPDHYLGAGHHHADSGMFHIAALGVDWITEASFVNRSYNGNVHNLVQIDQLSTPDGMHARGKFDGGLDSKKGAAFGMCDSTYQYTWAWNTQPFSIWGNQPRQKGRTQLFPMPTEWELEDDPAILKIFAGTARYRFRPWWPTYNHSNLITTLRGKYNPVQFALRSVGMVRGEKPYVVIVDDVKKDDQEHLYQWVASLCGGVWEAKVAGLKPNQIALAYKLVDRNFNERQIAARPPLIPENGSPILLVTVLDYDAKILCETIGFEVNYNITNTPYDRLVIDRQAKDGRFKVVFQAFNYGDSLPQITFDANTAKVNGSDDLEFIRDSEDKRTHTLVRRNGDVLIDTRTIEKPDDPLL